MILKQQSIKHIQLLVYGAAVLGYTLYLLLYSNVSLSGDLNILLFFLNWVGIFVFIFILLTWKGITNETFTPYIIFMTFLFLFNYGQPLMWAFGIHIENEIGNIPIYPGFEIANNVDIIKAQLLTLTSVLMFHLGAVFSFKISSKQDLRSIYIENKINTDSIISLKVMFYVCLIINLISTPMTFYVLYNDFEIARSFGYSALYYSEYARRGISLLGFAEMFFFPSLIGLLIGSKFDKKARYYVYIIFSLFILINIVVGERGTWVYKIVALVWLLHKSYKPLNFKKVIRIIPIGVIGLYLLNAIVSLRNVGITLENISQTLSFKNSPIIAAFFEMGNSMNPALFLLKYDWDIWPNSNTYILALGGLLSNKLLDIMSIPWEVVSGFFREYLGISWGPGFSIVAEPLLNFGPLLAPIFMIIFGFLISSVLYIDKNINYKVQPIKLLFVISSLDVLTHLTRNSIHVPLKEWFYSVVFLCLVIYLIKSFIRKKRFYTITT